MPKDRDGIRKEMTDTEWTDLEIRRLDVEITELLVSFGSLVRWMQENGQIVPDVPSLAIMKNEETRTLTEEEVEVEKEVELPGRGKQYPIVAFVGASMSELDKIRNRHLSGMVGKTFTELYLEPIGLTEDDVYVTSIVKDVVVNPETGNPTDPDADLIDEHWTDFANEMLDVQPRFIVALGKTAAVYLDGHFQEWVPHPRAIRLMGDSGEVARKMARLKKSIETPTETISGEVIKSVDEKQIVYGVVMEPYVNDTDENWTSEDQIESAAHSFMKNFRLIDTQHTRVDIEAVPVESWLQHEDTVINGQPVKAGSWVMGVKIEDSDEWEKVRSGEYTGFSIDAFAHIAPDLMLADT